MAWLVSQVPTGNRTSLVVTTSKRYDDDALVEIIEGGAAEDGGGMEVRYDGEQSIVVIIEGHAVAAKVDRPDPILSKVDSGYSKRWSSIVFTTGTEGGREAVLRHLGEIAQTKRHNAKTAEFYVATNYGSWNRRRDLPARPMASVILKDGQVERLVDDLGSFLADEAEYVRRALPYHRGYLLYGPPGTGKSSLARAIAEHFKLDIYYLPLSDLKNDSSLMDLVGSVAPGSVLLLEDIDSVNAATDRSDTTKGATLSGLLQSLDGIATPHGLITIMTTNWIDSLDEALIRKGRVDVRMLIDVVDARQIVALFEYFYQEPAGKLPAVAEGACSADVLDVFKLNMHDPATARVALGSLVPSEWKKTEPRMLPTPKPTPNPFPS
jgi:hypothetical protein